MDTRLVLLALVVCASACGGGDVSGGDMSGGDTTDTSLSGSSSTFQGGNGPTSTAASDSGDSTSGTTAPPTATTPTTTGTPPVTSTTSVSQDGGETTLIQAIVADLASREGVDAEDVEVLVDERVDWPDASLGCPEPGVSYIQVVTPGYRVILGIGGETFDYRATVDGTFRICQNALTDSSSPNPES